MNALFSTLRAVLPKWIELTTPRATDAVLHWECGTGMVACLAAQSVPRGKVIGTDGSADCVSRARANAAALGIRNVQFERVEPTSPLPVPWKPESFDVVLSSPRDLGLVRPLLRRSGRVGVLSFGNLYGNEWLTIPESLLEKTGIPVSSGVARGDDIDQMLLAQGWVDPLILRIQARMNLGSAESWWRLAADAAGWPESLFDAISQPLAQVLVQRGPVFPVEIVLARARPEASMGARRRLLPQSMDASVRALPHVLRLCPADAQSWRGQGLLLDVREPEEQENQTVDGAVAIPRGLLEREMAERFPDRSQKVLVFCGDGRRSVLAAATLLELGYEEVRVLEGGLTAWQAAQNKDPVTRV